MRYRGDMGDHMGGVPAVTGHAGHFMHVFAGEGAVAPAAAAIAAGAAEPADAGARADAPALDAIAERVDHPDDLVPGNPRVPDARHQALDRQDVAVTDAAGLHLDAHLFGARKRKLALHCLQLPASFSNDHRAHFRHESLSYARKSMSEPG